MAASVTRNDFIDRLSALLAKEHQIELEEQQQLASGKSAVQLQRKGLALVGLTVNGVRSAFGGKDLLELGPSPVGGGGGGGRAVSASTQGNGKTNKMPPHLFRPGDIVSIATFGKDSPAVASGDNDSAVSTQQSLTGVVSRATDSSISIALRGDLPDDLGDRVTIRKLANGITHERMVNALESMRNLPASMANSPLIRVIFGETIPTHHAAKTADLTMMDSSLNSSQIEAVRFSLAANEIALVHGPPGTGKTSTLVEIIRQLVKRGDRVLACAPSNIAVDNLAERLVSHKVPLVRIGHPARLLPSVVNSCLDVMTRSSDNGAILKDVQKDLDKALAQAAKAKRKSDRKQHYLNARELRKELVTRERNVTGDVLRSARVVLTTLNGAASRVIRNEKFDTVVIDEAAQAVEPECWIAIQRANLVILAGDHMQLPPTVRSQVAITAPSLDTLETESESENENENESKENGRQTGLKVPPGLSLTKSLEFTLFDRLLKMYGSGIKRLLTVQYRAHEDIMAYSSQRLYGGKLVPHESVQYRTLSDLSTVAAVDYDSLDNDLDDIADIPVMMIDTTNCNFVEDIDEDSSDNQSKFNQGEVNIAVKHVKRLIARGVPASEIGVISPYNAQVACLVRELRDDYPELEIGSVDGFQGREKEAIVISLVRSNDKGEVGFLADYRRINVAITRPRRHLCIIGDSGTASRDPFIKRLIEFVEENGHMEYADNY
ncbi:putative DNA-binding protein [Ramicandelaber brevisporus]|nr:putative DNA-binding protein [Ramicandelaber brevisporus]